MNLCPNGHDKDRVGVNSQYRCKACSRDRDRARNRAGAYRPCTHSGPCNRVQDRRGRSYCQTQRRPNGERPVKAPRIAVDGFEGEFGPIPPTRSPKAWVDRVALARYLDGSRVGRQLTPGEHRALHLLTLIREE